MTLQTSQYEIVNAMDIGDIVYIETITRYGFLYRTGVHTIELDMLTFIIGVSICSQVDIVDLNKTLQDIYVEKISTESAPPVLLAEEATKLCICDWTSVQQVGCKCGAITPYKGGLYE